LEIFRELRDPQSIAIRLGNLAGLIQDQGDLVRAQAL
jgi:hypothetical protein